MGRTAYRESHPLPYVLIHWTHLLSMLVLGFTGFFIHYPFLRLRMDVMREAHFIAMYLVLVAFAARVWYAFAGSSALVKDSRVRGRDFRNFGVQAENRGQFFQTVRYYLFLRPTHPPGAKYNPLQKTAYLGFAALMVVQAYTGFALYGPAQTGPLGAFFELGVTLAGGLMAVRVLHYAVMWAFILILLVHVYMSVAEDFPALPLMFFWRETVRARPSAVPRSSACRLSA